MKLTIFGTGYVGLVTGACFAEVGHDVLCVDVDADRIEQLNQGILPIWEPGLDALVERNSTEGRLHFTADIAQAVQHASLLIIAVGTPPDEDGSADLQYVLNAAKGIAKYMTGYCVIVNKSTVPVGTADEVATTMRLEVQRANAERLKDAFDQTVQPISFDIVSNPEFLKEGSAISDFLKPDRIIIGTDSDQARQIMRTLYEPFNRNQDRTLCMDTRSAELTKYAANAMLATKISFMNEMANLAEHLGADIEQVRKGIGSDPRIGYQFIYPGCGYGGSCFPKDVRALRRTAENAGYAAEMLGAIEGVNERQKRTLFTKLTWHFGNVENMQGKVIAIWGLAFKPNTDDMRDAPSCTLIEELLHAGTQIQAFDPAAMKEAARMYGQRAELRLSPNQYEALQDADALVICTEWQQFRAPDFDEMAQRLKAKIIVDGRNLYQPTTLIEQGWTYISVGRAFRK